MEPTLTPDSTLAPDEQTKLRELTAQSWNLELAISGVALYAILALPDLLNAGFDYLQYNFLSGDLERQELAATIPIMAYSMLKAASYVLFAAFLLNFVMRAFWVGLVGLQAVFPSGILYDRLPMSTDYTRQRLAKDLGPLDRYILWLDKRCNVLFALAFQVAILMAVAGIAYLIGLLIFVVIKPFVPTSVWSVINAITVIFFVGFMILYYGLNHKRFRDSESGGRLQYKMLKAMRATYLGLYKPFSFITYTFTSHIPKQKITKTYTLFIGAFMVLFMVEYVTDLTNTLDRKGSLFNRRHLFSVKVDSLYVDQNAYDNQRPAEALVDVASIQADVIREPYLKLFIAYPKALDTLLTKLVKEPKWPDSLSRQAKRQRNAIWSSQQAGKLIYVAVNNEVMPQPGLFFTHFGPHEQKGWQTVLVPHTLRTGSNFVSIGIKRPNQKEPDLLTTIPFWYVPEKLGQTTNAPLEVPAQASTTNEARLRSQNYSRRILQGNVPRAASGTDGD